MTSDKILSMFALLLRRRVSFFLSPLVTRASKDVKALTSKGGLGLGKLLLLARVLLSISSIRCIPNLSLLCGVKAQNLICKYFRTVFVVSRQRTTNISLAGYCSHCMVLTRPKKIWFGFTARNDWNIIIFFYYGITFQQYEIMSFDTKEMSEIQWKLWRIIIWMTQTREVTCWSDTTYAEKIRYPDSGIEEVNSWF